MQTIFSRSLAAALVAMTFTCLTPDASAATVSVTTDNTGALGAFMTVFDLDRTGALPASGGSFQFDSGWGVADTVAIVDDGAETLTLQPNQIGDYAPFWYISGTGTPDEASVIGIADNGNKWMDAANFISDDSLVGDTITFEGTVLSNTLTANHTAIAFIRDFAADFSSFTEATTALTPGAFSFSLVTDPTPGRHIQYGFNMVGENVYSGEAASFGEVVLSTAAVPEPSSLAMLAIASTAVMARRRRRS